MDRWLRNILLSSDLMASVSICIECLASCMSSNRLRLNSTKTELIWLGTSRRLLHFDRFSMTVCGADDRSVDCVRDLGVLIDNNMTLLNDVNNVAGIFFYQLRQLRISRRLPGRQMLHTHRASIHTRVDYCNGLLTASPKYLHEKLQSIVCATAKIVLQQLPHRASVYEIMWRLARDVNVGSCQIQTAYSCTVCLQPCTESLLATSPISARLPRSTLIWDHLWHLNGRCQTPGRKKTWDHDAIFFFFRMSWPFFATHLNPSPNYVFFSAIVPYLITNPDKFLLIGEPSLAWSHDVMAWHN